MKAKDWRKDEGLNIRWGKRTKEWAARAREEERDPQSIDSCLVYLFIYSWSFVIHLREAADINISTYNPYKFAACIYRAEFADSCNLSCGAHMNRTVSRLNDALFPQRWTVVLLSRFNEESSQVFFEICPIYAIWLNASALQTCILLCSANTALATELDGLQQITPSRANTAERSVWKEALKCSVLIEWDNLEAKWIVMIFDYANFINRNKLSHILSVSSWLKRADFQTPSSEPLSYVPPARPMAVQFNSCQWRSLFQAIKRVSVRVWHLKGGAVKTFNRNI